MLPGGSNVLHTLHMYITSSSDNLEAIKNLQIVWKSSSLHLIEDMHACAHLRKVDPTRWVQATTTRR